MITFVRTKKLRHQDEKEDETLSFLGEETTIFFFVPVRWMSKQYNMAHGVLLQSVSRGWPAISPHRTHPPSLPHFLFHSITRSVGGGLFDSAWRPHVHAVVQHANP